VALAPLLSDGPIIVLALFALSRLDADLLRLVRIAGGLFLLYLAWGACRSIGKAGGDGGEDPRPARGWAAVLKGAALNALNPAPYLFWGTVGGPILLGAFRTHGTFGAAFLIGFYGTLLGGCAAIIRLFGAAGRLTPRARKLLGALSASALLGFGLFQLGAGLSR
jgi:threonine/homoserine/homoserine lactone efflux protein